jgi:hypothetical protein
MFCDDVNIKANHQLTEDYNEVAHSMVDVLYLLKHDTPYPKDDPSSGISIPAVSGNFTR